MKFKFKFTLVHFYFFYLTFCFQTTYKAEFSFYEPSYLHTNFHQISLIEHFLLQDFTQK